MIGQCANAFACRSATRWVGALNVGGNRLLVGAVGSELAVLTVFLAWPPLADLLGQRWPTTAGWIVAALAVPAVIGADALHKALRQRWSRRPAAAPSASVKDFRVL